MGRFGVIVGMGVVLSGAIGLLLRWLWRERGRPAATGRKLLRVLAAAGSLLAAWLLVGGLQLLWHERRGQPVTPDDLRILDRADAFLKDEASWNRNDDKRCEDDRASRRFSLSCALEVACIEVLGRYEHTRPALQEARFVVEDLTHGRQFEGRLMGFNNLPETRFEDVKRVLRLSRERVAARLEEAGPR